MKKVLIGLAILSSLAFGNTVEDNAVLDQQMNLECVGYDEEYVTGSIEYHILETESGNFIIMKIWEDKSADITGYNSSGDVISETATVGYMSLENLKKGMARRGMNLTEVEFGGEE